MKKAASSACPTNLGISALPWANHGSWHTAEVLCVLPVQRWEGTLKTPRPQIGATVSNSVKAPADLLVTPLLPHHYCKCQHSAKFQHRTSWYYVEIYFDLANPLRGSQQLSEVHDHTWRTTWLKHPSELPIRKGFTKWQVKTKFQEECFNYLRKALFKAMLTIKLYLFKEVANEPLKDNS